MQSGPKAVEGQGMGLVELRKQMACAVDWPGDELGKEDDEEGKNAEMAFGGNRAAIYVDNVSE